MQEKNTKPLITIALDFDGTVVFHDYPRIGEDIPLCIETLKRWQKDYEVGYILFTMRDGVELENAVEWFKEKDIPLYGIQTNPTQHRWTTSPKAHADFSIDDREACIQLVYNKVGLPGIDWKKLIEVFEPRLKKTYDDKIVIIDFYNKKQR